MKRKIDWKKTNAFGGVVLELSEKERMTLNNHVASMNQGDYPVIATLVDNGHIYLATIHGDYCYTIDTLNGILFLNSLFDFGVFE
ncbi:MAG TPA: hypothetical protein PLZ43_08100 [bacterium]|nr:hypothetical protein [bacterium]